MRKKISFILVLAVLMSLVCVPVFAAKPAADDFSDPKPTESSDAKGFYSIGTPDSANVTIAALKGNDDAATAIGIDANDNASDGFETLYEDSEQLLVTLTGANAGKQYIIFLTTESSVPTTNSSILYVVQTAASIGTVEFKVAPKPELYLTKDYPELYLFIQSNAAGFAPVHSQLAYCAGGDHWLEPTGGGAGSTVNGKTISWNDTDDTVYLLYAGTVSDDTIKADLKLDAPAQALEYAVNAAAPVANSDGKRFDQAFSFDGVPDGSYKLAIAKPGKYVPKIIEITVSGDTALGEYKLWLYGDVNYDGKILANDAAQMTRKANGLNSVFTTGTEEDQQDRMLAADVVVTGSIMANDVAQVTRHANGLASVFTNFK